MATLASLVSVGEPLAFVGSTPIELIGSATVDILFGPETGDGTAPLFAGLVSVVTSGDGSVLLSWVPGTDDISEDANIVYDAFIATSSEGQDYGTSSATSAAGAASLEVTGLTIGETYFFVVLARDEDGNRSTLYVERWLLIPEATVVEPEPDHTVALVPGVNNPGQARARVTYVDEATAASLIASGDARAFDITAHEGGAVIMDGAPPLIANPDDG